MTLRTLRKVKYGATVFFKRNGRTYKMARLEPSMKKAVLIPHFDGGREVYYVDWNRHCFTYY